MEVKIGTNYIVIGGRLYDFTSYKDVNAYAILHVINDIDRTRFKDELSEDRDDEIVTNEEIFMTPYGHAIAKILNAYFNFTTTGMDDADYNEWHNINQMIEEKSND